MKNCKINKKVLCLGEHTTNAYNTKMIQLAEKVPYAFPMDTAKDFPTYIETESLKKEEELYSNSIPIFKNQLYPTQRLYYQT